MNVTLCYFDQFRGCACWLHAAWVSHHKAMRGRQIAPRLLPHRVGGSSSSAWLQFQDVDVVTVSLPGHERRVDEQPPADWKQVIQVVIQQLRQAS